MQPQPSLYIPHGGGPCFFMDWPGDPHLWDNMAAMLQAIPASLPQKPAAILVVTAHWEAPVFTFASAVQPRQYDYYGFPEHTYQLTYDAPGAPELAELAAQTLREGRHRCHDRCRGALGSRGVYSVKSRVSG